ncbi:MAG: ATP-binding protein, partial [Anaerolineales bacterium]
LLQEASCRLVTIIGPGGIGKTRLAVEAARSLAAETPAFLPDGAFFIPLAALTEPGQLAVQIANTLGLRFTGSVDPLDQLAAQLASKTLLLVLDNCEHISGGMGVLIGLLQQAPNIKLLATSRERLNLMGEWVFDLYGLPYPSTTTTGGHIGEYSAVAVFLECARRAKSDFRLTHANQAAVVRICQIVDGMPLALELAAAWVRSLEVDEIAEEISRNLDFLSSTVQDLPPRHRSLRATFDHSWGLLASQEQQVFAALSVFYGGFDREAALAVAGADVRMLAALVDKSLLQHTNAGRYQQHDLLKQYARDKLTELGQVAERQRAHLDFYLQRACELKNWLRSDVPERWRRGMSADLLNFRAALKYCVASQQVSAGLELAGVVWRYWWLNGLLQEGIYWFEQLLALPAEIPAEIPAAEKAHALYQWASLEHYLGSYDQAKARLESSLELARQSEANSTEGAVLNELGLIALEQGDFPQASTYFEKSLEILSTRGDRSSEALLYFNLGRTSYFLREFAMAEALHRKAYELATELNDQRVRLDALNMLATLADERSDYEQAYQLIQDALELSERIGDRFMRMWSLERLGMIEFRRGNLAAAVRSYAAGAAFRQEARLPLPPINQDEYSSFEHQLRAAVPPEEFERLWQEGRQEIAAEELAVELAGPSLNGGYPETAAHSERSKESL